MDIIEIKTVDMLTVDSVSILTQKFIELDGVKQQVGANHRKAYQNSIEGRKELVSGEPLNIVNSVMAIWGNEPTVVEQILVDKVI